MSVTNYTELKSQLLRFIHRDDFDTDFDIFLTMVESEIFNNPVESLNTNVLESSVDLVSVDGSNEFDLPEDYLSMRDFRLESGGSTHSIPFKSPDQLIYRDSTGLPSAYTIFANKIRLDIVPDEIKTFKLDYTKEFAGLTVDNPSNEILLSNPNMYFFGCMWAAKILEEELADANMYYTQLINSIKGSNKKAKRNKYGSGLAMGFDKNIEQIYKTR